MEKNCEKDNCSNKAIKVIKDLNIYSFVCEQCYRKYRI